MNSIDPDLKAKATVENTERLWTVLDSYRNDPDGLTKYELIDLCDFDPLEGRAKLDILKRAMRSCRRRAEREGMFIPHATPKPGRGHVYLLTDNAEQAVSGYIVAARVTAGMRKSEVKHQEFIETDLKSLPPTERAFFERMQEIRNSEEQRWEQQKEERFADMVALRQAAQEERAGLRETENS